MLVIFLFIVCKHIGALLNYKNVYFVPMRQDDPLKTERSVVADCAKISETLESALNGNQAQPIYF